MSLRNASLAIKPAGSSFPTLIRKPVLSRVNACCKSAELRANVFCAIRELTFVLIRVMPVHPLAFEWFLSHVQSDVGSSPTWHGCSARGALAPRRNAALPVVLLLAVYHGANQDRADPQITPRPKEIYIKHRRHNMITLGNPPGLPRRYPN
jgi:hypothetical protein